jgi:malate dehydrogenase
MRKKVTVVGSGFVGSTTAQRIVDADLADVVITDILDGVPAGKALDMMESGPITRTDSHATGISTNTGDYSGTANSDIVVITAGFPRKPGMSQLRRGEGRRGTDREAFAELHHYRGDQSAGRYGAGGV